MVEACMSPFSTTVRLCTNGVPIQDNCRPEYRVAPLPMSPVTVDRFGLGTWQHVPQVAQPAPFAQQGSYLEVVPVATTVATAAGPLQIRKAVTLYEAGSSPAQRSDGGLGGPVWECASPVTATTAVAAAPPPILSTAPNLRGEMEVVRPQQHQQQRARPNPQPRSPERQPVQQHTPRSFIDTPPDSARSQLQRRAVHKTPPRKESRRTNSGGRCRTPSPHDLQDQGRSMTTPPRRRDQMCMPSIDQPPEIRREKKESADCTPVREKLVLPKEAFFSPKRISTTLCESPFSTMGGESCPYMIRNTFLDSRPERSPSLERFFKEREVRSSPPSGKLEVATPMNFGDFDGADGEPALFTPRMGTTAARELFLPPPLQFSKALESDEDAADNELAAVMGSVNLTEEFAICGFFEDNTTINSATASTAPEFASRGFFEDNTTINSATASTAPDGAGVAGNAQTDCSSIAGGIGSASIPPSLAGQAPPQAQGVHGGGWASSSTCSGELPASDLGSSQVVVAGDASRLDLQPVLGSAELPSRGSTLHRWGACKPCAFIFQAGCKNDVNCQFCHLCEPGEKKRRKKERQVVKREVREARPLDQRFHHPQAIAPAGWIPQPMVPQPMQPMPPQIHDMARGGSWTLCYLKTG